MLLRTFSTREKEPMLKMFNTYIKSKMEYCCIVWLPVRQKWIYELEKIQKTFTSKQNGMEELDYHERLKKLNLYSLERRRERFMIIYGWQQLEEKRENVLRLTATTSRRDRRIISPKIPDKANGKRLSRVEKRQIFNCPARKVQRLFKGIARFHYKIVFPFDLVKFQNCSPLPIPISGRIASSYGPPFCSWHQKERKIAPTRP